MSLQSKRKRLILKSPTPPSPYKKDSQVVLIGGVYDGARVPVDTDLLNIQYGTEVYTKVEIEDNRGFKVTFYRHSNITDIMAISMSIAEYKKPRIPNS